jgi:hypothetical protein
LRSESIFASLRNKILNRNEKEKFFSVSVFSVSFCSCCLSSKNPRPGIVSSAQKHSVVVLQAAVSDSFLPEFSSTSLFIRRTLKNCEDAVESFIEIFFMKNYTFLYTVSFFVNLINL